MISYFSGAVYALLFCNSCFNRYADAGYADASEKL